jgi:hypothetical protein
VLLILFTSLLFSFVPFCEDGEANNGIVSFENAMFVLWDLGHVLLKRLCF